MRRAVEAIVTGDETTSASAVRQKAFDLLGRDSESLSARNFERILRDSHDADMIDLRRRGNDFEVARAVDAAPIVDQLKTAEQAHKAAAAASAPPPPPRGMAHRGVGARNKSGRAVAPMDPKHVDDGRCWYAGASTGLQQPQQRLQRQRRRRLQCRPAPPAPVVAEATPAPAPTASAQAEDATDTTGAPSRNDGRRGRGRSRGRVERDNQAPTAEMADAAPAPEAVEAPAKNGDEKKPRKNGGAPAKSAAKAVAEPKAAAKKSGRPPARKAAKTARK